LDIKHAIISTLVFAKPDFLKDFIIYTNAIEKSIKTILMQNDDSGFKESISFISQSPFDDE
jgi:hypothetical protein